MMSATHIVVGMASWAALSPCKDRPLLYFGGMAVAAVASLLPDIDHPRSTLGRKLWFISEPLSKLIGHRGVTHSLIAVLACAIAAYYWKTSNMIALAVVIGYASHLLADYLTIPGVPLLWPRKKKYMMPGAKTTNGTFETVFLMMSVLIVFLGSAAVLGVGVK